MLTMSSPTDSITVTAVADDIDEGSEEDIMLSYTLNPTSVAAPAATTLTITDNDSRGITSTAGATVTVVEEGTAGSYTLVLDSEPTADVTVMLTLSAGSGVDISNLTLATAGTVTPGNTLILTFNADVAGQNPWNTAQTVTVAMAADDGNSIDETATISYVISGGAYGSVTLGDQAVSVMDDDASVTVMADSSTVSVASGSVTITFTLANPAAGEVIIDISTGGSATLTDDYTLSATQLSLDNSNPPDSLTGSITSHRDPR